MRLSGARSVLVTTAVAVAGAGVAVTIVGGGDQRTRPSSSVTETARISGHDLAAALSETTPIRTSPATIDRDTLRMVAAQQEVETAWAWPLEIPGDDRTAWLFAGRERVALVVPRTVVDPERGPMPDASSVFGAGIEDLVDQPLVATQAGGGQEPRTLVLVPAGVEPPRIVARSRDVSIREMPRRGRLFADQIQPGEELVVGTRRIGPSAPR